jgi:hypothetical protein
MPKEPKRNRYSTKGLIENEYEPGGKVLRNKLGIRKRTEMEQAEAKAFQKTQMHFYKLFSEDPSPAIDKGNASALVKEDLSMGGKLQMS